MNAAGFFWEGPRSRSVANLPSLREATKARPDVFGLELVDAMDRAKDEVDQLLALVAPHRAPPYRALEVGAGVGSRAIELGLRGHATLGYEEVGEFVTAAKGLAAKQGTYCNARFIEADTRKARPILEGLQFDLVLALDALGPSASDAEDARLLADVASVAAPGAVLVARAKNGAALATGPGVKEDRVYATDAETNEVVIDVRFRTRVYDAGELGRLIAAAGWRPVDLRADLAGAPFDAAQSKSVVLVAVRG